MVPNLDCMNPDELMDFWYRYQGGRRTREVFPEGGKGTRIAVGNLACYASNKATAMNCRLRSDIRAALIYEQICDTVYNLLPGWARW